VQFTTSCQCEMRGAGVLRWKSTCWLRVLLQLQKIVADLHTIVCSRRCHVHRENAYSNNYISSACSSSSAKAGKRSDIAEVAASTRLCALKGCQIGKFWKKENLKVATMQKMLTTKASMSKTLREGSLEVKNNDSPMQLHGVLSDQSGHKRLLL
jgi:hypothetical protein